MPRRSHTSARRRTGAVVALALLAALALGWGLPLTAVGSSASSFALHTLRIGEAAFDDVAAVAAPVVEALTPRADRHSSHEQVRDLFGAAAVAISLLLLVAQRRRLTTGRTRRLRVAVVAHGGRAPPA